MNWKNRIVGSGSQKPDQLLANPLNWRTHPTKQQDALLSMLESIGVVQQVVVNKRTGHLIDGHLRVMLALRHDVAKIPVVYVDVSLNEERQLLATIDTITELATTDKDKLQALLDSINGTEVVDDLLKDIAISKDLVEEYAPAPKKEKKLITCPECGAEF